MNILFKILRILLYTVIVIIFLLIYLYYNDGKLGKGEYFLYYANPTSLKSFNNKNLYIADIIDTKYNDKYILLCRVPLKSYTCNNKDYQQYINKLQYLIVVKSTNKIYVTYNYKKFVNKLQKLSINLSFEKEDLENMNSLFSKNKHIYSNDELPPTNCKEDNTSTLIEIK